MPVMVEVDCDADEITSVVTLPGEVRLDRDDTMNLCIYDRDQQVPCPRGRSSSATDGRGTGPSIPRPGILPLAECPDPASPPQSPARRYLAVMLNVGFLLDDPSRP